MQNKDIDEMENPKNPKGEKSIWVGDLNNNVTEDDLIALFQRYGHVESVNRIQRKHCAHINFDNPQSPSIAMRELQGFQFKGCTIKIRWPDHPIRPAVNAQECRWFRLGCCKYTNPATCIFKHILEHEGIDKEKECIHHRRKGCKKQGRCPYLHIEGNEGIDLECRYYRGAGCTKSDCKFKHIEGNEGIDLKVSENHENDALGDEYGDESDLSDGEYLEKSYPFIPVCVRPVTKPWIKKKIHSDKVYRMTFPTRGRALIICNHTFPKFPRNTRKGADMDTKNLKAFFEKMGFLPIIKENLSCPEIVRTISEETKCDAHMEFGAFVLVIMSHGAENGLIMGTDCKYIPLQVIRSYLTPILFPAMAGKPKVLIVQACSGRQFAKPEPIDSSANPAPLPTPDSRIWQDDKGHSAGYDLCQISEAQDIAILKSSSEGYKSKRDKKFGSPFIRAFIEVFMKHCCHKEFLELATEVTRRINTYGNSFDYGGQTPEHSSTLVKSLYFFPGIGECDVNEEAQPGQS